MKKLISTLSLSLILMLGLVAPQTVHAEVDTTKQEQVNTDTSSAKKEEAKAEKVDAPAEEAMEDIGENEAPGFTQTIKKRFIEGGVGFMMAVLLCLIIGIAIAIERIIYLSLSTVNTKDLLTKVEEALISGGVDAAKEVCSNTRGPVASIFYEGLERADEGAEEVEKAIIAGGSVQMGLLEKGVSWVSLFIALAPMLGFLGTVIGMIDAFDSIEAAGGIEATQMAGGIKTALITTVGGLIVAIILQVFYNVIIAKIDNMVNAMEDASNTFVKIVSKNLNK